MAIIDLQDGPLSAHVSPIGLVLHFSWMREGRDALSSAAAAGNS
ncbi:hypothetical protein FHT87_001124 [Rhizobium sp. BK316]|jgi:hypothetical protein|nr:hypothetical protein [Rhizobium sp. BK316]MBB3407224.1 hypothetical protein [Rhizobium sp. BK316]